MSTTHQVPLPGPPSGPSSFVQDDRPSILQRHPTYYKDSQVVLKVEDRLFYFDKALLCQFDTFKDMFEGATAHNHDATEGLSGDNPITLQGITAFQMESLDTVVRASWTHGEPKLELDQWKAILQLCTMWECSELRDYSIRKIEEYKLNPMDSILLAAKCRVEKWLKPAYTELCIRADPLTIEDATHLGLLLFAFLCQLREKCRFEGPINSNGKRKKCGCNHYKTMSSPSQETVETAMNDISQSLLWPPIPEEMPHTPSESIIRAILYI
ncbi:hypothetical protein FRC03_002432 [Tulasnella sp. 419]|nr:hypothetical protein FRC03_002432 [Tulasnella sp. 419]